MAPIEAKVNNPYQAASQFMLLVPLFSLFQPERIEPVEYGAVAILEGPDVPEQSEVADVFRSVWGIFFPVRRLEDHRNVECLLSTVVDLDVLDFHAPKNTPDHQKHLW